MISGVKITKNFGKKKHFYSFSSIFKDSLQNTMQTWCKYLLPSFLARKEDPRPFQTCNHPNATAVSQSTNG